MIAKTKGAFTVAALVKEGEIDKALNALVTETERVKRYGFTASEYDRARINVLKQYESLFNDRDKQKNRSYTNEYVHHFTDGGYIPGIETEYQLISQIAPQIPIEQVNQYAQSLIGDKNIVIGLTGPDKADIKYPTEAQLLEDFIKAQQLPVKPYEETVSNEPLIPELPAPGRSGDENGPAVRRDGPDTRQRYQGRTETYGLQERRDLDDGHQPRWQHFVRSERYRQPESIQRCHYAWRSRQFLGNRSEQGIGRKESLLLSFHRPEYGKRKRLCRSCRPGRHCLSWFISISRLRAWTKRLIHPLRNRMIAQLKNLELNPMVAFSDTPDKGDLRQ